MAKINTRPTDLNDESTIQELQEILENATNGVIGIKTTALVHAGNDVQSLLENVKMVIGLLTQTASSLFNDLAQCSRDNMVLTVKLAEALDVLESMIDVSYDEALDHATADLMEAFAASGGADVTPHGELGFDGTITYSKSDLKPILREAISRYVDLKLK